VPSAAVVDRDGKKIVFTIDDNTVKAVPVTVGPPFGSGLELVDGPGAGTKVVSSPPPELRAGQKIKEKE
jgi:HlyD family secretion protein